MTSGKGLCVMAGAAIALPLLLMSCGVTVPIKTGPTPAGPTCQARVSATASARGQTQGPVEVSARLNWRNAVNASSGFDYSHWNRAQHRDMTCSHDGRLIKTWTCTASAEPCRE